MKKILILISCITFILVTGCAPSSDDIRQYEKEGNVTQICQTLDNLAKNNNAKPTEAQKVALTALMRFESNNNDIACKYLNKNVQTFRKNKELEEIVKPLTFKKMVEQLQISKDGYQIWAFENLKNELPSENLNVYVGTVDQMLEICNQAKKIEQTYNNKVKELESNKPNVDELEKKAKNQQDLTFKIYLNLISGLNLDLGKFLSLSQYEQQDILELYAMQNIKVRQAYNYYKGNLMLADKYREQADNAYRKYRDAGTKIANLKSQCKREVTPLYDDITQKIIELKKLVGVKSLPLSND